MEKHKERIIKFKMPLYNQSETAFLQQLIVMTEDVCCV